MLQNEVTMTISHYLNRGPWVVTFIVVFINMLHETKIDFIPRGGSGAVAPRGI